MSDLDGQVNRLAVAGDLDLGAPETEIRFADGRILRVRTELLAPQKSNEGLSEVQTAALEEILVIPVLEEQLEVGKRVVETGRVQLHKAVETFDVTLNEPLAVRQWQIERVTKHEVVDEAPATRQEGDTIVYSVVEERLVLTKQLLLVEEIRVTEEISERRDTQTVVLHREVVKVEREDLVAGGVVRS